MNWQPLFRFFVQVLVLILLLLAAALIFAAPAPKPRPRPPAHLHPGRWILQWGTVNYLVILSSDRQYVCHCPQSGKVWSGSYWYDKHTRTLHVTDSEDDGATWFVWTATIRDNLTGTGSWQKITVPILWKPDRSTL